MLCRAAAQAPSVRFVLGFGENLPDGVTPLAEAFDDNVSDSSAFGAEDDLACAAITLTAQIGEPVVPLFRSMQSLLAQGGHSALALGLKQDDVLLNPYPLTGPVGLGVGLTAWLVSGCTLVPHQPVDYDLFRQQLADTPAKRNRGAVAGARCARG
jgi:acyl-CoA synthetase (AMP-forming)/AMP-acid ligase II